jgi:hypothetical protein
MYDDPRHECYWGRALESPFDDKKITHQRKQLADESSKIGLSGVELQSGDSDWARDATGVTDILETGVLSAADVFCFFVAGIDFDLLEAVAGGSWKLHPGLVGWGDSGGSLLSLLIPSRTRQE